MRFNRLDLIKYGKFSDRSVMFPVAKQDFHLIVGPNEAGKSTLRSAIVDLLFGIPPRSQLSFLHPLNELRLGASISNASGSLDFHRAKALKQTLRSPQDVVLPDTALTPFLDGADRHFFDQMFGLDHTRLVSGGNSILNAENDVGQILFQSAAGVASLGKIRDALIAEADKLWAPRKANNREYYIAADQLDKATTALKEATVRTKVWVDANSKVESLQEALSHERERHQQLQSQRNRLERIRRLAPFLMTLRDNEHKLAELGEVIELPVDAAATLATAERELAIALERLELRTGEVEKITEALSNIDVDEVVLELAADISKLDNLRLQYSAYERDIANRKNEIAVLWQAVGQACTQLDWAPDSESAIAHRMPTLLVRRELRQLVRDRGGIIQTLRAAEQAEKTKCSEIETLSKQLAELQMGEVKPALRAALANTKSFGDTELALQKRQATLTKTKSALDNLLLELGQWQKPLPELIALQPPSQEKVNRLIQERQSLIADRKAELLRLKNQTAEVARIELQIAQFKALHHPMTLAAVIEARTERDTSWEAIKTGEIDLQREGHTFEEKMTHADQVADKRLDDVEEATELQSLNQLLEREQQSLSMIEHQCAQWEAELHVFDDRWGQEALSMGLNGMPLEDMGAWIIRREKALSAGIAYQDAQDEFDSFSRLVAQSRLNLVKALQETRLPVVETDSLSVLCIQAEGYIHATDSAKIRHETLSAQLLTAQSLATTLRQATENAKAEESRWSKAWSTTLAKTGLPPDSDIGTTEGALELIEQIAEKLEKMRQIQVERIDTMNADLKEFSIEGNRLAQIIAAELKDQPAEQIAQTLANRLDRARESFTESSRLKEALRIANSQVLEAKESSQTAMASLKPLMEKAGVDTTALLNEAIGRSDEQRRLNAALAEAKAALLSGGDGLIREQLEAEIDAANLVQLAAELTRINDEIADAVQQQTTLSADRANALGVLSEIGGSDAATQAEAQRQEALAQMSDVAERYVKVFTAGRLLRWSIDRYREEKQGPLLQRAGAIFSTLTSGSFTKLILDFEREPMVLEGLRSDGTLVGISGMSDGTRDQLYLALRLAALEMHLEQAMPLPFIADDLFINYDDVRSKAGFEALKALSEQTQVIFLSHHDHLIPLVQEVFGKQVNVVWL
ncbi:AAA family ATPase [Methylicorpusculum oleiharenae]|uniref:YhaN family protein n=1 Tax=Methylicorpusculum oleiharenae TaxID=1338687 RepID=UPI001E2F3951|nr:YhaN family protein [Methylicorpusculum oleiharenae]MCD2453671.1 AAA family ATPase [Methylicorpusculum oleiharenae]